MRLLPDAGAIYQCTRANLSLPGQDLTPSSSRLLLVNLPTLCRRKIKGWSGCSTWVIKKLHYIGSHFYIRNAELVAQILEQETDVCPWDVFSFLGAYAYNA
jgi:hypothetical protein